MFILLKQHTKMTSAKVKVGLTEIILPMADLNYVHLM